MIRITEKTSHSSSVTIRIEGRLVDAWTKLAAGELKRIGDRGLELRLDLAELLYADETGIRLIRELLEDGARVVHASGFVKGLMDPDGGTL